MHPLTGRTIPIHATNYVISGYGTKAIMGVPGHDDRDLLFAQEHDFPIISVNHLRENDEGTLSNSDKVPKLLCNSTPITCVVPLSSWILYIFNHSSWDFLSTKVAQPY